MAESGRDKDLHLGAPGTDKIRKHRTESLPLVVGEHPRQSGESVDKISRAQRANACMSLTITLPT